MLKPMHALAAAALLLVASIFVWQGQGEAARIADVRNTKHNLGSGGPGSTKAYSPDTQNKVGTDQVCVFCHTPHGASSVAPLWNRNLSTTTSYTRYTSYSLDAESLQGTADSTYAPNGSSKLCLSCHDGVMTLGQVNVLAGRARTVDLQNSVTTMADTAGSAATGYTRNLDVDLSNDHPISITLNDSLAKRDGELRVPDSNQEIKSGTDVIVGVRRGTGTKPKLPLEPTGPLNNGVADGQIQCVTCHDPHIRESGVANATTGEPAHIDTNTAKFLRLPRFQEAAPSSTYTKNTDISCLACHDKNDGNTNGSSNGTLNSWAYSAHANPNVKAASGGVANQTDYTYNDTPADTREFPRNIKLWQAACLNCHDTHTAPGARKLLRGGVDGSAKPAIEETCYACHGGSGAINQSGVPNIKSDFEASGSHMPITNSDQGTTLTGEKHQIGNSATASNARDRTGIDFLEDGTAASAAGNAQGTASLGTNRHVECTDCHNPHRVVKNQCFFGKCDGTGRQTPDAAGTHNHGLASATYMHNNVASGVLRGNWGVEPIGAASIAWGTSPGFNLKRGDPGTDTAPGSEDTASYKTGGSIKGWVTREYQICLKCHSSWAYGNSPPALTGTGGRTSSANSGNSMANYTDQGMEFAPSFNDRGESTAAHRSWHPVVMPTGRTVPIRSNGTTSGSGYTYTNFLAPWRNCSASPCSTPTTQSYIGSQTMYCSDCHGSATNAGTVVPIGNANDGGAGTGEDGNPWGPHGSANKFILKGPWDKYTGTWRSGSDPRDTRGDLCFKCHAYSVYADADCTSRGRTGFYGSSYSVDGCSTSDYHHLHRSRIGGMRCSWCHVAVPHGWKNKALLVDWNTESGAPSNSNLPGDKAPYIMNGFLRIVTFKKSGNWSDTDCGTSSENGKSSWMTKYCNKYSDGDATRRVSP